MLKLIENLRVIAGVGMIFFAIMGLLLEDFYFLNVHSKSTWYLVVGLGLLVIFYKNIIEFDLFFMKMKLVKELNMEGEKILLRLLISHIILDSINKVKAESFFSKQEINANCDIAQSTDYGLKELQLKGYISYILPNPGGTIVNSAGGARKSYQVTIVKKMQTS